MSIINFDDFEDNLKINEDDNSKKEVDKGIGGWWNSTKKFISGVGKGALDGTVLAKKQDPGEDIPALLYSADIAFNTVLQLASSINSVLTYLSGERLGKAKSSASEVTDFISKSLDELNSIRTSGRNMSSYSSTKQKIEEIRKKLGIYMSNRPGQESWLEKWTREYLGKDNEAIQSNAFLESGSSYEAQADSIIYDLMGYYKMQQKIEKTEIQNIVSDAIDYIKGNSNRKPLKPKDERLINKGEYNLPEVVRDFRNNLNSLMIKTRDDSKWSEADSDCETEAAYLISSITKEDPKKFKEKEGFKELQRKVKKLKELQPEINKITSKDVIKPPKI
jgi:hypothetical protein